MYPKFLGRFLGTLFGPATTLALPLGSACTCKDLLETLECSRRYPLTTACPGNTVLFHLHQIWINLPESNDLLALARRFEQPCGVKLALDGLFLRPGRVSWPWIGVLDGLLNGVKLALDRLWASLCNISIVEPIKSEVTCQA